MKPVGASPIVEDYVQRGYSDSCPLIDMHGHLGPLPGAYLPAAPLDKMNRHLKRSGVRRIVCCPHEALLGDIDRGNALMQDTIDNDPELFLGYWAINPNHPSKTEHAISSFESARGFVGFKFLPDYHEHALDAGGYDLILSYANERALPILIHTWGGSNYNRPQQVEKMLTEILVLLQDLR